jgi:lipid-A-disaccharide synthase
MRIFVSTGEVSGDLHGSHLIKALLDKDPTLEIQALGGQRMASLGIPLLADTTTLSSIGLVEAIPFIVPTLRIQAKLKSFLKDFRPDLVVLIDYIGSNVKVGKIARKLGIPVVYYIAPQEWVWSTFQKDTSAIVAFTDLILAIFPEEARYYQKFGAKVQWIGHPLTDIVRAQTSRSAFRAQMETPESAPVVVLAPASRNQELRYLMPVLFETARNIQAQIPNVQFWLALSTVKFKTAVETAAEAYGLQAKFIPKSQTYDALAAADLLLTKSGTINLEAALLGLPQVVAYRVDPKTFLIGKLLKFKIPFMSPVNLVEMRKIVPEFLQDEASAENLTQVSLELLQNPEVANKMRFEYTQIRKGLGEKGAIARGAEAILSVLNVLPASR